jgi:hypothetical protein
MKTLNFLILMLCLSCGNVRRVDTAEVKRRMSDYKVRKISTEDIMSEADAWGQSLKADFAQNPEQLCNLVKTDSMKVEIVFFDKKLVKYGNPKIDQVLEAYSFASNTKQEIPDNLQKLDDSTVLYTFKSLNVSKSCKPDLVLVYMSNKYLIRKLNPKK